MISKIIQDFLEQEGIGTDKNLYEIFKIQPSEPIFETMNFQPNTLQSKIVHKLKFVLTM